MAGKFGNLRVVGGEPATLSEEQRVAVEDVLDAAAAWAAGELPIEVFETIGQLPGFHPFSCPGAIRFLAVRHTDDGDPRLEPLGWAQDALIERQGWVRGPQGRFEERR